MTLKLWERYPKCYCADQFPYGVPLDVTMLEILENTESPYKHTNSKEENTSLVDMKLISFTLEVQKLPKMIIRFKERFIVKPKKRKLQQCGKCWIRNSFQCRREMRRTAWPCIAEIVEESNAVYHLNML